FPPRPPIMPKRGGSSSAGSTGLSLGATTGRPLRAGAGHGWTGWGPAASVPLCSTRLLPAMKEQKNYRPLGCSECLKGGGLGFDITMAFQPIVDVARREIFAHEALVRGVNGEPACWVFVQVNEDNGYVLDQY